MGASHKTIQLKVNAGLYTGLSEEDLEAITLIYTASSGVLKIEASDLASLKITYTFKDNKGGLTYQNNDVLSKSLSEVGINHIAANSIAKFNLEIDLRSSKNVEVIEIMLTSYKKPNLKAIFSKPITWEEETTTGKHLKETTPANTPSIQSISIVGSTTLKGVRKTFEVSIKAGSTDIEASDLARLKVAYAFKDNKGGLTYQNNDVLGKSLSEVGINHIAANSIG